MEKEKTQQQGEESASNIREAGMMTVTGMQGVGKTYRNMYIIADYVKDKLKNKVKGRKCLIFDTNGEYTQDQFAKNGIHNFNVTRIALKDVQAWCRLDSAECRRIDAKNLGLSDKKAAVEFLLKIYRNGMLVLEDINTYILNVTFMEEIVGGLVNLRHRAVDVMVSYQSLRAVEPRIWQNSRWIRFHHQADNVMDIKNKVTNVTLFKIAQILVNEKYRADKRFFVYIHNFNNKIQGAFTKEEFKNACRKYLSANKKEAREYQQMNDVSLEEAMDAKADQYIEQYWGNN